jgi:betaine-aldehyde dehydrogenase
MPDCRLGPLVSEGQYSKVLGYVESGLAEGATLLTGGKRPRQLTRGYFLQPTGEPF